MRILVASAHQSIVGGVETYLRDVLPALRERGHELAFVSSMPATPGAEAIACYVPDLQTWCLADTDLASFRSQVAMWNPDVVFSQGLIDPQAERMLVMDHRAVLFAHNHAATCVSGTRTMTLPRYQPCGRTFGPACLLHYLPRGCGGANPLTMLTLYERGKQLQGLLPRYRAVVVAGRALEVEYAKHGVPPDRLHCVPLFPTASESLETAPPDRAFSHRVVMLGRLYKLKGGRVLIRALARANTVRARPLTLVVAGDGPEREPMLKLARRLKVPLEFHGWLGPKERATLMRHADLLALPSVCPETFGLVGLEAARLGLPTVAFAVGGIPDWLVPGESGELAPGEFPSAEGLAQAIGRALASPAHWRKLSLGAWQTAQRYNRDTHVSRIETILHEVAGNERVEQTFNKGVEQTFNKGVEQTFLSVTAPTGMSVPPTNSHMTKH